MSSTRGNWVRSVLAALPVLVVTDTSVRAQGFGPDPFRPYNSMYDPYVYPLGPGTPGAGQSAAVLGRSARGGPNQYEQWLTETMGEQRAGVERYGQGLPYWRRSVDPRFDTEGNREYRPNRQSAPSFEETLDRVTRKYVAYFSETDPKKRAVLMREFKLSQRNFNRLVSSRPSGRRDALGSATPLGSDLRTRSGDRLDDESAIDRKSSKSRSRASLDSDPLTRAGASGAASGGRTIPPAPEITGSPTAKRSGQTSRTPADTLERARRFDDTIPSSARGASAGRPKSSRAIPPVPPLEDD
jgi:hypothetical protein